MRVLLDECVPQPLQRALKGHAISTIEEAGWKGLKNGLLLQRATGCFEVFITADKNLRYQQNLSGRRIGIIELPVPHWPVLKRMVREIQAALDEVQPGEYVTLSDI